MSVIDHLPRPRDELSRAVTRGTTRHHRLHRGRRRRGHMRRRSVWRRTVSKECVLVAGGRGTGGVRGKAVRVRDTSRSQTSQERPPSIFQSQGAEWLLCTTKAQRQLVYRGRKENGRYPVCTVLVSQRSWSGTLLCAQVYIDIVS